MPSRQDQLHAHRLTTRRSVSALTMRTTDPERAPSGGAAGAVLAGVLVTAILMGAMAAWSRFAGPPREDWRQPDVLVVAEGSGARYIWRDGVLHPVGGYASALLILGEPGHRTVTVPEAALSDVGRGAPLGIPGAPDAVPAAERLVTGDWAVCSWLAGDGGVTSVLIAGAGAPGRAVPPDDGLLVEVPAGQRYLIWRGHRHAIHDEELTVPALGWSGHPPVPVAPALVDALPPGEDIARIRVPDPGAPSAAVPGAVAGEVVAVAGASGASRYAMVLADGVVPVAGWQVDLVLADPHIAAAVGQRQPRALSPAEFAALPRVDAAAADGALLPAPPALARVDSADRVVCGAPTDGPAGARVHVDAASPPGPRAVPTAGRTADGDPLADYVAVPPGHGALVASGDEVSLVTDTGVRYPLAPEALAILGYAEATPVAVPGRLVSLLPVGPALDPAAARTPAPAD